MNRTLCLLGTSLLGGCAYSFQETTSWLVIDATISPSVQSAHADRYPLQVAFLQPNPEDPTDTLWIGQRILCEPSEDDVMVSVELGPTFECWVPEQLTVRVMQAIIDTQPCGDDVVVYGTYDLDPPEEIRWTAPSETACDTFNGRSEYRVSVTF